MFCNNCGTKLPDDAKFCVNCGNRITMPTPPAANPAPAAPVFSKPADLGESAAAPVQPQAPVYTQPDAPAQAPVYTAAAPVKPVKKKSGINWKVFIIMLLVGALIIGGGGFLIYNIVEGDLFGGSSNHGRKDDDDDDDRKKKDDDDEDEDEDEDKDDEGGPHADVVNPHAGWNQYVLNDLVFYLPTDFETDYMDEESAYFESDDYDIEIAYGPMSDVGNGITTDDQFAQMMIDSASDEYQGEIGERYGVAYVVLFDTYYEDYMIVGFYVQGDTGYIISAYGEADADVDFLIDCVTSGTF